MNKRLALLAIGIFIVAVVSTLLLLRGGALFGPQVAAIEIPLSHCDLQSRACQAELPGGASITLEFAPRPVRPMQDFTLRLIPENIDIRKADVTFTGVDMNMGFNRFALAPADNGFSGSAILPICVRDRMVWEARLRLDTPQGVYEVPFHFATEKQ